LAGLMTERRLVVVVERAQAQQVGAVAAQGDPPLLGQALQGHLGLEPVDLVGDAGHGRLREIPLCVP
jgi:hypothetical protein